MYVGGGHLCQHTYMLGGGWSIITYKAQKLGWSSTEEEDKKVV